MKKKRLPHSHCMQMRNIRSLSHADIFLLILYLVRANFLIVSTTHEDILLILNNVMFDISSHWSVSDVFSSRSVSYVSGKECPQKHHEVEEEAFRHGASLF